MERIWLLIRKRVVSPVMLFCFGIFVSLFWVRMHMGNRIPMMLILGVIYSFIVIVVQIVHYAFVNTRLLKQIKENVNYDTEYEAFTKEVFWYLANERSEMKVYIYPGWTQYFHVYLMELVRNHRFREITDGTVLAALTKALVTKHDDINFIAAFVDTQADRFRMPRTYNIYRDDEGRCTFTEKDRKVFRNFNHIEQVLGMDFVAEHIKKLLMENAKLGDLEEFFDELYYCGVVEEN